VGFASSLFFLFWFASFCPTLNVFLSLPLFIHFYHLSVLLSFLFVLLMFYTIFFD
jgi:hypothetical protein